MLKMFRRKAPVQAAEPKTPVGAGAEHQPQEVGR
jgi:hypothetical protein